MATFRIHLAYAYDRSVAKDPATCTFCNTSGEAGETCPTCGAVIARVDVKPRQESEPFIGFVCRLCGTALPGNARFCNGCGGLVGT